MAKRETRLIGGDGGRQPHRQSELDGELEVHVEELGPQRDGGEMRCEVGDVDAPRQSSLDLGPALAQHLFGVGVLPQIGDVPREPGFAAVERSDGAEAVRLVFAVQGEVHADVVGGEVAQRSVSGPRRRNHDRGTRGQTLSQCAVDAHVGAVAGTEIVARDDHQLGVVGIPQAFGE